MNEAQVRHDLIDPALKAAVWEALPAKAREGVSVCETMRKAILKEAFE